MVKQPASGFLTDFATAIVMHFKGGWVDIVGLDIFFHH